MGLYFQVCLALLFMSACRIQGYDDKGCISNTVAACRGRTSNDYPSCEEKECTIGIYFKCSNGQIYGRACPAGLKYDSKKKRCEYKSEDCPANTTTTVTVPACINKTTDGCRNVPTGDYAACDETVCRSGIYYSCSNNNLFTRNCPANRVYDTNKKSCQYTAVNCPAEIVRDCIRNTSNACVNAPSRNYPACDQEECMKGIYYSCYNNKLYSRYCPAPLVYQSRKKRCEHKSDDCPTNGNSTTMIKNTNNLGNKYKWPSGCVKNLRDSCQGKESKNYPSCVLSDCMDGIYYACDKTPKPRFCETAYYYNKIKFDVVERRMIFDGVIGQCVTESIDCPLPLEITPIFIDTNVPGNTSLPPERCVTNSVNGCQGKENKNYPACSMSECQAGLFYTCDKKPRPRLCYSNKYFDKIKQQLVERPMIFDSFWGCMKESTYCPLPANIVP